MKAAFERARKALDFLERHQIEPSPANYELALGYIADPLSELARAIDAHTDGGLRLTAEAAAALAERHFPRGGEIALGRRERAVAAQAEELVSLSSGAQDVTSALERDVGAFAAQPAQWPAATDAFVTRLSDAERQLAEVRAEIATLQSRIGRPDAEREDRGERDELTQALNQQGAGRLLEQLAEQRRDYVMLMFSLDDLIGINERFGRPVGDNVLNAFAATLKQVFARQELIRWTGNEFVVVMHDTVLAAARLLAEEALEAMRARRLKLRGSGEWIGVVTASAGIVAGRDEPAAIVLQRARANVSAAAVLGGNRSEG